MSNQRNRPSLSTILLLVLLAVCILVPVFRWFKKERVFAIQKACISNLMYIEGAKAQAASEMGIAEGSLVTQEQISRYIKGGFASLECGAGGTYSLNPVGIDATCNIPGHHLPGPE